MLKRLPLLIAVVALAVWLGNFIINNFLATSLIAYGDTEASREAAIGYAPSNPLVIAARGKYLLYRAEPPRPEEAIVELRRATLASPRDYRFWLELGRAYENIGDVAGAEKALEGVVELAPRSFETRWAQANFLLRMGKTEASLENFRQAILLSGRDAARPDERATLNVYNAITGALGANPDVLRGLTPANNVAQAYLAGFFATHEAIDPALEIWRRLPMNDHASYRGATIQLLRELQGKGRFAEAREVWNGIESLATADGALGSTGGEANLMLNAGFERAPLSERFTELADPPTGFDWIIGRHAEVRVRRTEMEKHGGNYSLQLTLAASMQSEFQNITQFISVEPSQSYRLSFFVKAKNISSAPGEAPLVEVADAAQPMTFALPSVIPAGTNDWNERVIAFTTPAETRGLRLTIRCPQLRAIDLTKIAEVWFDDFKLERAGQ
ncbi:MAG: hypothetical protein ACREBD_02945 [Blastocatellia bacterium]